MTTELIQAAWRLVHAQGRMLDRWSEADDDVKAGLWRDLHDAGDRLRDVLENQRGTTMKKRCPYAAEVWIMEAYPEPPTRLLIRCERRRSWWPHQHRAKLTDPVGLETPSPLRTHQNATLRWRSTNTPDYHIDYKRGPAEVIE